MGAPCPHHCPSPSGGSGLPAAVLVLIVIVAAAAGPVVRAVADLLEVVAIGLGSLLILSAVTAALVIRARRRRGRVRPVILTARQAPPVVAPRRAAAAIESPRADLAALTREHADTYVVTSRGARPRCTRGTVVPDAAERAARRERGTR